MLRSFFMALGMFSIFPARNSWRQEYASRVIPMLPIVGLVIGLAWYGLAGVSRGLPAALHVAAVTLAPFVFSGFLHVDGFMDSSDAVFSRRPLEERRRILKDSNVGAFAVVAVACLFLLQFCAVYSVFAEAKGFAALIFIPVMSRCAVSFALLTLKPISQSGLLYTFKEGTRTRHTAAVVAIMAVFLALGGMAAGAGYYTLIAPGVTLVCSWVCSLWLYKQMDGFSGDLCGCGIVIGELCGLIALACI